VRGRGVSLLQLGGEFLGFYAHGIRELLESGIA